MGCFLTTPHILTPNTPETLIMHHVRKNTRRLDVSGSGNSMLFVDKCNILWKICTTELVQMAELIQINNTIVMALPNSNYLLKPISVTRLSPTVVCICQPMAECDLYEWGSVPFKWDIVTKFLKQVADGIRWLHDLNICHGDIKPENIVIMDLNAYIIDFDFIASLEDKTQCHTKNFKPSSEIISEWDVSNSIVSKRCDVYAFGKTILFMLFRLQSHRGNISILWWRKNYILSGHAHNFQGLEKLWADIAFRCCRRNPPEIIPAIISTEIAQIISSGSK